MPPSVGPLIVSYLCARRSPAGRTATGELPEFRVRRMMIADHQLRRSGTAATLRRRRYAGLATQFQLAALAPLSREQTHDH
jgi:hypothetical protein